jgi:hypothetical protein
LKKQPFYNLSQSSRFLPCPCNNALPEQREALLRFPSLRQTVCRSDSFKPKQSKYRNLCGQSADICPSGRGSSATVRRS